MNTILLTGSSGFIGSHLCLLLLERGYTVFTVDSHINSSENTLNRVKKLLNQTENDELLVKSLITLSLCISKNGYQKLKNFIFNI